MEQQAPRSSRSALLTAIGAMIAVLALIAVVAGAATRAPQDLNPVASGDLVHQVPTVAPQNNPLPAGKVSKPTLGNDVVTIPAVTTRKHARRATTARIPVAKPACLNSFDPRCGTFFWSPAPSKNQAIHMTVEMFPADPRAGEEVTFVVKVTDADARVDEINRAFGDRSTGLGYAACVLAERYGRWITPARERGALTQTFRHVYEEAGTYHAMFAAKSGTCGSPYTDAIELPLTVSVEAAA